MDSQFFFASHPQHIGSSTSGGRGIHFDLRHQGCKEDRCKDCSKVIPKYAQGTSFYLLIMDESK